MEREERRRANALDEYWDATLRGESPPSPEDLDDVAIAVIRSLGEHRASPQGDVVYQRVRRRMLAPPSSTDQTVHRRARPHPSTSSPGGSPPPHAGTTANPHAKRTRLWVALVAIVVLVAVLGTRALGPTSPAHPHTIAVATQVSTPSLSVTPPDSTTRLQLELPANALPSGAFGATFDHRAMPAHSTSVEQNAGIITLRYVLSGQVTVRGTHPMQLVREGDTSEELAANIDGALDPGDALILHDAGQITYTTASDEPVHVLAWTMTADGGANSSAPDGWSLYDAAAVHMAVLDHQDGPAIVRLRDVELAPGDDLSPPPHALLVQLVSLGTNAAGETVVPVLGRLPDGGRRNAGRHALTMYQLVVEPAS